jgi:hypothetical protein
MRGELVLIRARAGSGVGNHIGDAGAAALTEGLKRWTHTELYLNGDCGQALCHCA